MAIVTPLRESNHEVALVLASFTKKILLLYTEVRSALRKEYRRR
jgi:hypothetical protein